MLGFELVSGKLLCLGETDEPAEIHVTAFDTEIDVFYRSPEQLAPRELEEEIRIHFPDHILERSGRRVVAGSLQGAVLLQPRPIGTTMISPLAALAEAVKRIGDVNSGILEAANGGLLFVRRSGDEIMAHASAHSITEFAALSSKERDKVFPDFSALEMFVSGPDVVHFTDFDLDRIQIARKIALNDLLALCEFSEEGLRTVESNPTLFTTILGAASIMASIVKESAA